MRPLEKQQEDVAGTVESAYQEMTDLQEAIESARLSIESGADESSLRGRGEVLRSVVQKIECEFTATGKTGCGPGRTNSRLAAITSYAVIGDSALFTADSANVFPQTPVVSR
jgi:hypothetical protein